MGKVTGPLFSLDASGTIAKAITYSKWRGINYVRRRVVPNNPNSTAQQEVRGCFSTLSEMWKRMPQLARDPFLAAVRGLPLTDRNRHVQANVAALQGDTDLNDLVMSVASGNAIPPVNVVESGGVGTIDVTADAPTAPPGYTLTSIVAAICLDGDPSPAIIREVLAEEDVSAPYAPSFTGLAAGTYQVATWCKWTRDSDSRVFYSEAVRDQATVT